MWWDFGAGYRKHKYFSLSNSYDMIDQFNFVGYSDVCIYPKEDQLSPNLDPDDLTTKGTKYVFGGFIQNNQTGTE